MGQPIKLSTVANDINIHVTIFNLYYVTLLTMSYRKNVGHHALLVDILYKTLEDRIRYPNCTGQYQPPA